MERRLVALATLVALGAACEVPVCGSGWVEANRRCTEGDPPEPKCDVPCDARLHQVCDTEPDPPACDCAAGYDGSPCEWVGVLSAPGFDDDTPWSKSEGAAVRPNERLLGTDKGVGHLPGSAICNSGVLSQAVEMPPYEAAQPLVADVRYQAENVYGLGVGYGQAWRTLPRTGNVATGGEPGDWVSRRICLGQAAYGGEVEFKLGAVDQQPMCDDAPEGDFFIDRMAILPANKNECPSIGEVLNGEANDGEGGWEFIDDEPSGDTEAIQAGFDATGGRNKTSGARIYRERVSSGEVGMSTKLSVPRPETLPSPALRFWWNGTTENRFHVEIGTFEVATVRRAVEDLVGNGGDTNVVYCLPPWTYGNVVELGFSILLNREPQTAELVVDDVEIVSDPEHCGEFTRVFDPGFESAPNRTMGVTTIGTDQWVEMREDSELARSGKGALELGYDNARSLIFYETWVLVPDAEGPNGPALVIQYKYPDPAPPALPVKSVLGRAAADPRTMPPGPNWNRHEICLPQKWSNRWFRVQFRVGDFLNLLDSEPIDPPTRIYLDDFEVMPSSTCPAESAE